MGEEVVAVHPTRVRRITLAVMAGSMLFAAGCSAGGREASGGVAEGGVALTIWADDKYSRAIKGSATQWGEQNDVRVNVQTVSKDLQTVFVTASQAGKGPDLVRAPTTGSATWCRTAPSTRSS
jgi:arabinogalactan oligomer / maltooligosaccharide transport system substrate-binding protein